MALRIAISKQIKAVSRAAVRYSADCLYFILCSCASVPLQRNDILELMPYIQGDAATTIAVTRLIVEYL